MKKILYRILTFSLCAVLMLLSLPSFAVAAPRYENSGMEFMDETEAGNNLYNQEKNSLPKKPDGNAPDQYKLIQNTKLYINYRIWKDEGVLCYGSYRNVPGNDFKTGTQPPGQPERHGANDGYYANPKGGSRGEWRYHGWDVSGNKLTNIFFIPDSVVTKFNERDWIRDPWGDALPEYKRPKISDYNTAATTSEYSTDIKSGIQTWISKAMDPHGGVPLAGNFIDPEVFRYLNVESAPTIKRIGQGRMWHIRPNKSIWYQTVAVPVQEEKKDLPVEVMLELLTKLDTVQDLGTAIDDEPLILEYKVTAELKDDGIYYNDVKKSVYYTRQDIAEWILTFNDTFSQTNQKELPQQEVKVTSVNNIGTAVFTLNTTYGVFRRHNWDIYVTAKGEVTYTNGETGNYDYAGLHTLIGTTRPADPPNQVIMDFTPMPDIPEVAFDGVPFAASDHSEMSKVQTRRVFVDGIEVNGNQFFSGSYIFPGTVGENGRFAYVDCEYQVKGIPGDAGKVVSRDIVYIYPTKPIANFRITSNTWKQNRIIRAQDTSNEGNIQLVIQEFPIVEYEWNFGGDTTKLRKGTDTNLTKEFLYKQPGIYSLTLRCKNTLGKWSDPYTVDFQVLEDVAPAVGVNLSESVYTRSDKVNAWYYFVGSTDGDVIKSSGIELWHDNNNDGVLDQKLQTWSDQAEFPEYTPTKLGYYKYVVTAQEDIVSDTLPQYITETDKKSATYEVEFWVDNYQPLSDLYVNIPIQRPSIDVNLMLDKNLEASKTEYIKNNRINMSNWLLGKNIIPNVSIWDMKTYTYEQPASTSVNTGGSYPSSTTTYSSNGYSGTLDRTSVSNNRYSRDEGHYTNQTESKTASESASNTNSETFRWTGSSWSRISKSEPQLSSSRSYSDSSGFTGTLYKGSGSQTGSSGSAPSKPKVGDTYTYYTYWSVTYSGTVTRTVKIWVPNIVWYDNYTGYYSGTIYKNVRQPYSDPFNPTSIKYVLYISDGNISEPADLNMVMGYAKTAKLYLAGVAEIQTQRAHDKYFSDADKSVETLLDEILKDIAVNSPDVERLYLLRNETFIMNVGQLDLEGDPIVETGMQYVHEPGYYDNPTGNEAGTVAVFNEDAGWNTMIKSNFANTGKYTIYRRVKDRPSADPKFADYSYYSGNTSIEIYVVRKPIALATLDWDYDTGSSIYKTRWVDLSYDPDHQYSRADKGIVDRNIKWRRSGGQWNYGIPDNLTSGTYELNYYVLDPEGYWSDPFIMNFTLSEKPSIQFTAALRTLSSDFSLSGIPSSEMLEAYDLWTRYPQNVKLEMALYNGASRVSPLKTVTFGSSTGTRVNNDITWNNVNYQIPRTLPDRAYDCRISAVGEDGLRTEKSFIINVVTPLELEPAMPAEVTGGGIAVVAAQTSKYAGTVNVVLFHGTSYARSYGLSETENTSDAGKSWEGNAAVSAGIPEGSYIARFTAAAPNGTTQSRDVPFRLVNLGISNVSISGYWNHWRGQMDIFGERMTNEPHRFLSLERVKIDITTIGDPERVTIRFSPELEAMQYTDPSGNSYDYADDFFGSSVVFPEDSTFTMQGNHISWEYHLPLAPSTKGWDNNRLRPQYRMTVTAYKGNASVDYVINDIDITGNIYDLTYIQPKD